MNLNLSCYSLQISDLSLRLNPDILETNVINIILLFSGILYLGSDILSKTLSKRQQEIAIEFLSLIRQVYQCQVRVYESRKNVLTTLKPHLRDGFYKRAGSVLQESAEIYEFVTKRGIEAASSYSKDEILRLVQKDCNLMSKFITNRVIERVQTSLAHIYHGVENAVRCYVVSSQEPQFDIEEGLVNPVSMQESPVNLNDFPDLDIYAGAQVSNLPIIEINRLGNSCIYELVQVAPRYRDYANCAYLHRMRFNIKMDFLVKSIQKDSFSRE